MRFLIDEDLPHSVVDLFHRYGHSASHVRDIGLRGAKDDQIARYAHRNDLCLVTGDFDFSDIRNYPPEKYAGIVVLEIPRDATVIFILSLLKGFLEQDKLVMGLPGKLAIVEAGQIRIRKGIR